MNTIRNSLYKIIGSKIKLKREELRISQAELSEKLNLSRSSISNIEIGRHQIQLTTLYEIAIELGIDIKNLIPDILEINTYSKYDSKDYSVYLNNQNLDSNQKTVLTEFISNI